MFRSLAKSTVMVAVICFGSTVGVSSAQTPAAVPAPAPQTFWNWMGIPSQPLGGVRNRNGNFPGLERKPPLKPIADPANLASDNAAIKKAAEIKAQEDMAAQKIKAIKYLATIGCGGCYEGVDKALAEALDDCTEAVRYEAVQAILAASACGANECVQKCVRDTKTRREATSDCWVGCMKRTAATMHLLCGKPGPDGATLKSRRPGYGCGAGGNCPTNRCACGDGNCCTSEILNKLSTMAFEKDDQGCWKEPSPRVRAMARQALRACGPHIRPMTDADIPVPEEVPLPAELVPAAPAQQPTPEPREEVKPEPREEVKPEAREERTTEPDGDSKARLRDDANSGSDGEDAALSLTTSESSPVGPAGDGAETAGSVPGVADGTVARHENPGAHPGVATANTVGVGVIPVAPDPEDLFPTPPSVARERPVAVAQGSPASAPGEAPGQEHARRR